MRSEGSGSFMQMVCGQKEGPEAPGGRPLAHRRGGLCRHTRNGSQAPLSGTWVSRETTGHPGPAGQRQAPRKLSRWHLGLQGTRLHSCRCVWGVDVCVGEAVARLAAHVAGVSAACVCAGSSVC